MEGYKDLRESVMKNLRISMHGVERASMLLVKRPFRKIENSDLAIAYYIEGPDEKAFPILSEFSETLGLTEEDLYEAAMQNEANIGANVEDASFDGEKACFITSNKPGMLGASAILIPGMEKRIREVIGTSYVLLPMSKNEFLAVECRHNNKTKIGELKGYIESVNDSTHPNDVLSSNIYLLDKKTEALRAWDPRTRRTRYLFDMDGTLVTWKGCNNIEETYEEGYFLDRDADEKMVPVMKALHAEGKKVGVLSAVYTTHLAQKEKMKWLKNHGLLASDIDIIFCPYSHDKHVFLDSIGYTNVLIDDYSKNLHAWSANEMPCIKYYNGINGTKGTWNGPAVDVNMSVETMVQEIKKAGGE